jgi:endonuclease V-like protein UPF0215 family
VRGLGYKFDFASAIMPVADLAAGANTGHRVHLRNYDAVDVVLLKGVASAGTDNVVVTLQEHTAATAGTSANLAAITEFYVKSEATLDGDETWTEVTQAAAATMTLAGATYAALQVIATFTVEAGSLSAGYEWVSVNIADPGAGGTIPGCVLMVPHGLKIQRRPDLLANPNT